MSRTSVSTTEVSEPAPAEAEQSRIQAWFSRRSAWSRRGLAVLAGALATLGHAPFQIVPAFIVAIVVLVWLLDAAHIRPRPIVSAFGVGWWFGLGHFATGLYWIASAFLVDSQAYGFIYGVPAVAAMAGGLALF
jgi:apolipoprotein N-acyltransferase